MDKSEVTVDQFAAFVDATGYVTQAEEDGYSTVYGGEKVEGVNWRCDKNGELRLQKDYDLYPVTFVTWTDAVEYARWAGKRLPTEIEWIHAFRESKNAKFKFAGSNSLRSVSWHSDNAHFKDYNMVCSHKPNSLGIYDMSGNVAEMCVDEFDKSRDKYSDEIKVAKGGSFVDNRDMMKYTGRIPCGDNHSFLLGFRCVKDI